MITKVEQLQHNLNTIITASFSTESFRSLYRKCSSAVRLLLCRKIADGRFRANLYLMIEIIIEETIEEHQSIHFELKRIIESLNSEEQDNLIRQLINSQNSHVHLFTINIIADLKQLFFIPLLIGYWNNADTGEKRILVSALSRLGTPICESHLLNSLKCETDTDIIIAILTALMNFSKIKKHTVFATYLDHSDYEVRLTAAKGLNIFATSRQQNSLLKAFTKEKSIHILDILMNALLRFPNQKTAQHLLETALQSKDRQVCNMATLRFRQLPDNTVYDLCRTNLKQKLSDIEHIFYLTELSFLDYKPIYQILKHTAESTDYSETVRGAAIEGLVHYNSTLAKHFLFELYSNEHNELYIRYLIVAALTRLWTEKDNDQILIILSQTGDEYISDIQTVLSFLEKRLRSKKIILDSAIFNVLMNLINSENINISMMTINILLLANMEMDITKLLPLLGKDIVEDINTPLIALVAKNILTDCSLFFHWLSEKERTDKQIEFALSACAELNGRPEEMDHFYFGLVSWSRITENNKYFNFVVKVINHILSNEAAGKSIKQSLSKSTHDDIISLLDFSDALDLPVLEKVASSAFLSIIDQLTDHQLEKCLMITTRFSNLAAKRKIMEIFSKNNELKPLIASYTRRALEEVNNGN